MTKPQRKLLELLERVQHTKPDGLYVTGFARIIAFNLLRLQLVKQQEGRFAITDAGRAALAEPQLRPGQHHTRHPWRDIRFGKDAKP